MKATNNIKERKKKSVAATAIAASQVLPYWLNAVVNSAHSSQKFIKVGIKKIIV